MVFWGHAPNSLTRMPEQKAAMEKLDLLVVIDPYPTVTAVLQERTDGVYLLPASTQFETYGSVTASNRSLQWREKIVEPLFESLPDHTIVARFAEHFGFADRLFRNIEVVDGEPLIEDLTREFNRGMWDDSATPASRPNGCACTWRTSTPSIATRCAPMAGRPMATITACPGRAGGLRR